MNIKKNTFWDFTL